ncbi:MAG: DUF3833 family protein [Oricola sp.]|jgi:hypothetical protein|nr:DUF3833 family protein [Oricola sp.]
MNSQSVLTLIDTGGPRLSPIMRLADECLGGERKWRGTAHGLFGLINRGFSIQSSGEMRNGVILFTETLAFDDGETQRRFWRLAQTADGLSVEGPGIEQTKPAKAIGDNAFELEYKISLGVWRCVYRDFFTLRDDGGVDNRGYIRIAGAPVMTVTASAPPRLFR